MLAMNAKQQQKTSRWFMGHIWFEYDKAGKANCHELIKTGQDCVRIWQLLNKSRNVKYCKWSLEKGDQGNLHYQFLLEVMKPVRRSAVFKDLGMEKGEWIEPVLRRGAANAYVEKDRTHIAGPFEWNFYNLRGNVRPTEGARYIRPAAVLRNPGVNDRAWFRYVRDTLKINIDYWTEFMSQNE